MKEIVLNVELGWNQKAQWLILMMIVGTIAYGNVQSVRMQKFYGKIPKMNTDERRAKRIALKRFFEDNLDTPENRQFFEGRWQKFMVQKHSPKNPQKYDKPEIIAKEFLARWNEFN